MKIINCFLCLLVILSCSTPNIRPTKKYDRKEWKHWSDADKNCLNTRHEILKARSLSAVKLSKKGCSVVSGDWADFYYPEKLYSALKVDVDHVIPLKHAHDSGGGEWTAQQKEKFANDPENLVLTNRKYNRQKGAKTIAQWLPVNKDYACKYVKKWFVLKEKYKLLISKDELKSKSLLPNNCAQVH